MFLARLWDLGLSSMDLNGYQSLSKTSYTSTRSANQNVCYKWQQLSPDSNQPMPAQRNKHAMCMSDGAIYVYGGRDKSIVHRDLWKFKLDVGTWERMICKGEKPSLLQEHTMIAYKRNLYLFGGQFSSGTENESPLWIMNLDTLVWRKHRVKCEVMTPLGRRGHSAIVVGNQMIIYGGYLDMRGSSSEMWLFDMDEEMWHLAYSQSISEEGPGSRHNHSAVLYNNAMWVLGGMCDLQPLSDLWKYHLDMRSWSVVRCKNSPPELHGHTACVMYNYMIITGGENQWQLQDAVWLFHFESLLWQRIKCIGDMLSPRSHHVCTAIPTFLMDSSVTSRDSSLSVPTLQTLCPPELIARPKSSPCSVTIEQETANEKHLFKNKVSPSNSYSNVELICSENPLGGSVPDTPGGSRIADDYSSGHQTVKLNKRSSKCLDYEESDVRHGAYQSLRLDSQTDIQPLVPPNGSDSPHLSGFDNPVFRESSGDLYSPNKRLRQSLELLDDSRVTVGENPLIGTSVDSELSTPQCSHIPAVMKSGSLDSLLQDLGGVKINYLQVEAEDSQRSRAGVLVENAQRLENALMLEDIENYDYTELELSHDVSDNKRLTHKDKNANNTHTAPNPGQLNHDDYLLDSELETSSTQLLTKDFMLMDSTRSNQQNIELQTFQHKSDDPKRKTSKIHDLFSSSHHQRAAVESVSTSRGSSGFGEVRMSMIVCGGKEARKTCDILPLPMWRFDFV